MFFIKGVILERKGRYYNRGSLASFEILPISHPAWLVPVYTQTVLWPPACPIFTLSRSAHTVGLRLQWRRAHTATQSGLLSFVYRSFS